MTFTQTYKQSYIFCSYSAPYLGLTDDMREKRRMSMMTSLSLVMTPKRRNQELSASFPSCDQRLRGARGLSEGHLVSPGVEKEQNHHLPTASGTSSASERSLLYSKKNVKLRDVKPSVIEQKFQEAPRC